MNNKFPLDGFPWKDADEFSKDFNAAKNFFNINRLNRSNQKTMRIAKGSTSVEFFKHPKCDKILAIGGSSQSGPLICTDSGIVMQRGFPWSNQEEQAKAFAAAEDIFRKNPKLVKIPRNKNDPFSVSFIKKNNEDGSFIIQALGSSKLGGWLGEGGFGRVKRSMYSDGRIVAEKIQIDPDNITESHINKEQEMAINVGLGLERTPLKRELKYYTSAVEGSSTLDTELKKQKNDKNNGSQMQGKYVGNSKNIILEQLPKIENQ